MIELSFKDWMEAFLDSGPSANRIRDLRTQRSGQFTGFKNPPSLATRFGSDVVGGLGNYVRQIKGDNTTQEPSSTFDFSKEFSPKNEGEWITFTIPWNKSIMFFKDKNGNERRDPFIGKKARHAFLSFMVNHEETRQKLLDNYVNIDSIKYYGASSTNEKDEDGNEMVLLKFMASKLPTGDKLIKWNTKHPNHKYVYNTGENK